MSEKFIVRSLRKTRWFWADNLIIDAKVPGSVKLTYFGLCRFANNETGKSWPSYETISSLSGVSRRSVIRAIEVLEKAGIIHVTRRSGKHNLYTLLTVTSAKMALVEQLTGSPQVAGGGDTENQVLSDTPPVPHSTTTSATQHHELSNNYLKEQASSIFYEGSKLTGNYEAVKDVKPYPGNYAEVARKVVGRG